MKNNTKNLVYSALFLAIGLILPSIFHAVAMGSGKIFLPMHIPVLLAGLFLGGKYGFIVGAILPFLSSILTSMPPIYPVAVSMCFELLTYGFITGYLYKNKKMNIYVSLVVAMLAGRVVSGVVQAILLGFFGNGYSFALFFTATFVEPLIGIAIQLIFVPIIVKSCERILGKGNVSF